MDKVIKKAKDLYELDLFDLEEEQAWALELFESMGNLFEVLDESGGLQSKIKNYEYYLSLPQLPEEALRDEEIAMLERLRAESKMKEYRYQVALIREVLKDSIEADKITLQEHLQALSDAQKQLTSSAEYLVRSWRKVLNILEPPKKLSKEAKEAFALGQDGLDSTILNYNLSTLRDEK